MDINAYMAGYINNNSWKRQVFFRKEERQKFCMILRGHLPYEDNQHQQGKTLMLVKFSQL
jgi:hypothetical protein